MAAGNQGQPLIRQPVAVRGVRKQELEFALCLEPSACRCLASSSFPPLSFKEAFRSLTKGETVAPKLASSPQSYSRYDGKLATAFH